jgi:NADH-quinone oxidoreductase subunit C
VARPPRPLPPPEIESRLRAHFGDAITAFEDSHGHAVATVSRERYHDVVRFLRDEPDLALDFLDFTGAVDFGERFEVVTQLHSLSNNHEVRVKVALAKDDAVCPTISDLFAGANWHERETMEMFGIEFPGHPLPVKLLLPEPFEGHPLRKDFALMSREAKPWPGAVEGEEEEEE